MRHPPWLFVASDGLAEDGGVRGADRGYFDRAVVGAIQVSGVTAHIPGQSLPAEMTMAASGLSSIPDRPG